MEELKMLIHNCPAHPLYALLRLAAYPTKSRALMKAAIWVHESTAPEDVPEWVEKLVPEEFEGDGE